MQRILLTGGSGLLGTSIIRLQPEDTHITATYNGAFEAQPSGAEWRPFDLTSPESVKALIAESAPDVIIHAGSIGSVDFADKNREVSHQTNVEGTQNILDAAKSTGARVIFISSNAVFDGNNPPYAEDDPVCPVNYYGELKAEGEKITLDDAAKVCWEVIAQKATGIFNVCGSERVTLYDLAAKTAEVFGFEASRVKAVPSSHFGDIATRPKDTSFDISKIENELGVRPLNIHDGLVMLRDTQSK